MWLRRKRQKVIAEALVSSDKELHPVGETLPEDQRVYCIKVVMVFLRAGVSLSKVTSFRELLEENTFHLSDRQHMSDVIPFIASQEQAKIKQELCDKNISIMACVSLFSHSPKARLMWRELTGRSVTSYSQTR